MKNNNQQNKEFYENIDIQYFTEMAVKGGFQSCKDLEVAMPYYKDSKSILEIGAGYGRCIHYLRKIKYEGKIYAIEYSEKLYNSIANLNDENTSIILGNILNTRLDFSPEVALWMWSGFIDFTIEEQKNSILKIYQLIPEKGKLLIDIPQFGVQTIALHADSQHIHFETQFGSIDCFIPSFENMQAYAHQAGFKKLDLLNYQTDSEKERSLYIFYK